MPIDRGTGAGVKAALPLRKSTHGVSASFLVQADDGQDYWCKALNNPTSTRIPINERSAALLGRRIGVAIPEPALVDLSGIVGWEFHPGTFVEAGWAHGAAAVEGAIETRNLQHRGDDDNRARHAGFYALMDWLAGGDQQWLYSGPEQNAYYSHDHGHFFPGGPDWTTASLAAVGTSAQQLTLPPTGLDESELDRLADELEATTNAEIDAALSQIPAAWPVADAELEALAGFIAARQASVAARLRSLLP